jgi:hypothetical protein
MLILDLRNLLVSAQGIAAEEASLGCRNYVSFGKGGGPCAVDRVMVRLEVLVCRPALRLYQIQYSKNVHASPSLYF